MLGAAEITGDPDTAEDTWATNESTVCPTSTPVATVPGLCFFGAAAVLGIGFGAAAEYENAVAGPRPGGGVAGGAATGDRAAGNVGHLVEPLLPS